MAGTRFIVDIRRHRGDSRYAVESIGRWCSKFDGARIEWLVRPDQVALVPPGATIGTADAQDRNWDFRICDHLVQSVQAPQDVTGGTFWVLSYDNYLLRKVNELKLDSGTHLRTEHLSFLYKQWPHTTGRQSPFPSIRGTYPVRASQHFGFGGAPEVPSAQRPTPLQAQQEPISLDEAVELAKRVLRNGGHFSETHGLPQKELRLEMCRIDARAAKRFGDPFSETLIPTIVDLGLQQGWLKRFRRVPGKTGTEVIYLEESRSVEPVSSLSGPDRPTEPQVPVTDPAINPASESSKSPAPPPRKHPNRATELEEILSTSRIGSLPETRYLFFNAIELELQSAGDQPIPLLELFSRAAKRAAHQAEEDGYAAEKNWPIAERCIRRLMLWAGVLIDEHGTAIADRIGSSGKRVASLSTGFRETCEGYLVLHIIGKLGNISYDDDPYYIGLLLYRRGKQNAVAAEELKSKADKLLEYLESAGKIEMNEERLIVLKQVAKRLTVATVA